MPRVHGQGKQKNKPFKGKSNGKDKGNKIASTKTKHISKNKSLKRVKTNKTQLVQQKKLKKINTVDSLAKKNQYLDQETKTIITEKMKAQNQLKIVLLLPCNSDANAGQLIKTLYQSIDKSSIYLKTSQESNMNAFSSFSSFSMFPITNKTYLKNRIQFIAPISTNIHQLIDLAKCADIICPILSCKSTNTQGMNLNPYDQGKAFDDTGYTILNMVRTLGVPTTVGVIQHLELHEKKHHDKITRLFKRFMVSELGDEQRILTVMNNNDLNKLIRIIDNINPTIQSWKTQRGYFMVENIKKQQNGNFIIQGFLKGNCINANQLIHLTGFDDFEIQKIQIKEDEQKARRKNNNVIDTENNHHLVQYATISESMFPFAKAAEDIVNKNQNDLLSALQGLKFDVQNNKNQKLQEQQNQGDFQDISDQEEQEQFDEQQFLGNKDEEKQKRIELQMRRQDQMQFEDQVQYTSDEKLREKYMNYQGLKNFKTSEWNHLENLPEEYDRIYTFKHYSKTHNNVKQENKEKAFAYPGFYVAVTVKGLQAHEVALEKHIKTNPLIATFLLKHQRKMTMLHARVKRNAYYPLNDAQVESNQTYLISMGFRKIYLQPIFSRCINGTQKTKFTKVIKQDYETSFFCSFYYYNYFPPAPVSIYRVNSLNLQQIQPCPIMYGQLLKCDPLHIILQRIILCGYPYKIHRRRSTVRYMFFNPKDVKFFRPIQVRTKMGLRGRIQESLGTHGLMKIMFSDHVKHNDTVCMYLYNRVYPKAQF